MNVQLCDASSATLNEFTTDRIHTMLKTVLVAAFSISLAAQAVAQNSDTATQSPPSPNASSQAPDSANSLPPGAGTATMNRPGDAIGTTNTTPRGTTTTPPVQR